MLDKNCLVKFCFVTKFKTFYNCFDYSLDNTNDHKIHLHNLYIDLCYYASMISKNDLYVYDRNVLKVKVKLPYFTKYIPLESAISFINLLKYCNYKI